ncbi:uncharacterized protein LOC133183534 [Saccostrea echinata]|uniref:uncharacterized protein LOC133183534 n=1 Tax=Saccostrea echinata TaxID=191078 RepID=UPI002A7F83B3|nr:uncharacterized protein LOC133183534 [Saccostrea echinata]
MCFFDFVYISLSLISLATSSATSITTTPAWQSPCGKTMVQSTLLEILGTVPKATVPIKGMLHNVIIELKETDDKIAEIQQYFIQHKFIDAAEANVITGEESNFHHVIGFPLYQAIQENETIEDVFYRDYATFSSVLVFLEQSSWDVMAIQGNTQTVYQMYKSAISKILGILCKYFNSMNNRDISYVPRGIMQDEDRDVNMEARLIRKRDFIILKDTRVLLKKMIPDYALLKQTAP